jgi:hypothetical protein
VVRSDREGNDVPTASIDIPLPSHLQSFLEQPKCIDIKLPKPGNVSLTLPNGGQLKALVDITKGIPDDCSMTFSLLLQLGPFLASIECLLKVLKLIQPLIDVISSLGPPPDPIKLPEAIKKFIEASVEVLKCVGFLLTPAGVIPFVKDLLCLIIKVLKCIAAQLKSIANVMGGIALQLESATADGNTQLLEQLQCAQENAAGSAAHVMTAIEPITALLALAQPFLEIAQVPPIAIPAFGSSADVEGLNQVVTTLESLVQVLTLAVEPLGGC